MRHFAGSKSLQLPGIVGLNGTVFFVPKSLSLRELYLETSTIGIQDFYPQFKAIIL